MGSGIFKEVKFELRAKELIRVNDINSCYKLLQLEQCGIATGVGQLDQCKRNREARIQLIHT